MEFRVINVEFDEVIDYCATIEEAKKISADNYIFHTSVEQCINGEWVEVLFDGMTVAEREDFKRHVDSAFRLICPVAQN